MCRLLAWVSTEPGSTREVVGARLLAEFTELARVHPDGWGMAWWGDDPSPSVFHSTASAADDPEFSSACATVTSDAALVHLRWATPGMAITVDNCHPFVRDDLALAHNGGIYPLDRLHQILPPEWESRVRGTTDSERYLLAVVAERQATGRPVADALADVVTRLFAEWAPSSLNALCLTPESVIVVSAYNPNVPSPQGPSGPLSGDPGPGGPLSGDPGPSGQNGSGTPADHYYALRYRQRPEGVVVASSGIDQPVKDGWHLIDNMTLLEIHRATGALSFRSLAVDRSFSAVDQVADAR